MVVSDRIREVMQNRKVFLKFSVRRAILLKNQIRETIIRFEFVNNF